MKSKTGEETSKEKFDAGRGWFMSFKERHHLYNIKVQCKAPRADAETMSYSEDPAKIINEHDYAKQQIGRTCHVGLSQLERRSQCLASKLQRTN